MVIFGRTDFALKTTLKC